MKHAILIVFSLTSLICKVSAQEYIKAKDANVYIGKEKTVIGRVKFGQEPGYLTSISYYLVTDSVEMGLDVQIPIEIWSKSKKLYPIPAGKIVKVKGVIKLNHNQPYLEIKNISDVEVSDQSNSDDTLNLNNKKKD